MRIWRILLGFMPMGVAMGQNVPSEACIAAQAGGFSGVALVARGGVERVFAAGRMAGAGSAAITPGTRFNIGSAGKMFTAVAVAQLVAAGKMRFDDPIGRYVSGLTAAAGRVTLAQLLTHSGGMGNFFTPDHLAAMQKARRLADLLPLVQGETPAFEPGSRFDYSNSGFLLLGLAVERASGKSYGDYLRDKIFIPAGMTASGLEASGATTTGMTNQGELPALPPLPPPTPGAPLVRVMQPPVSSGGALRASAESALPATSAGGLFTTAEDLRRFLEALGAGKLLKSEGVAELVRQHIMGAPAKGNLPALYYGYGFGVGSFEGQRWYGHNGGAPGLNAEVAAFPDEQLNIIVLANRDPPAATALFRKLRGVVFGRESCR